MNSQIYIATDGDNIGSQLEFLILTNKVQALGEFSKRFKIAMDWFTRELEESFKATVIFSGGDNILANVRADSFSMAVLRSLCEGFTERAKCTLSVGIGNSPREAFFALKLAKASGKNTIRHFEELNNG